MRTNKESYCNSSETSTYDIVHLGTFDVDNYGDCLFPLILEHHLRKRLGNTKLYTFSPTSRLPRIADYSQVYAFDQLGETFSKTPSCFVIGGGELLSTDFGLNCYSQIRHLLYPYSIKIWLLPIMIANAWRCPCVLNAVGMFPSWGWDEDFNEIAEIYLGKVDMCLVRDRFSASRLSQMSVSAEVFPDSAFSVTNLRTSSEWKTSHEKITGDLKLPSRYIVAQGSFYLKEDHDEFAMAVGRVALETGLPVVLLPICHFAADIQSLRVMQKILKKQGINTYLVNRFLKTMQTSSILSGSELYIGTSLHGAVVSLAFGKPAVSFGRSTEGKHRGVLSEVGLDTCHVVHTDEIPKKASDLLKISPSWFEKKVEIANGRINSYFDRMAGIIAATEHLPIPENWSQKRSTSRKEELHNLRILQAFNVFT